MADATRVPRLPRPRWAAVVRDAPLVSIDLVVRPPDRSVLVGWRHNQPARDTWFVPGGAVRKTETLDEAFHRIVREELGLARRRGDAHFLGVFEHHYDTNFSDDDGFGTHYVVLAHEITLTERPASLPDDQHARYRYMSVAEILSDADVHPHVKDYFRDSPLGGEPRPTEEARS